MKDHGSFRNGDSRLFAPLLIMLAALMAVSCIDDPPTSPEVNDYQSYLDLVWGLYDQKYVGFDEKDVDWDAVHDQYTGIMSEAGSREEMLDVIVHMVGELEDWNAFLLSDTLLPPPGYILTDTSAVEVNWCVSALNGYLGQWWGFQYNPSKMYDYTRIDSLYPYIAIYHFDTFFTYQSLSNHIQTYSSDSLPGIIIDVRMSDGYSLVPAQQIPSCFVTSSVMGFYTQFRNGPGHDDLSSLVPHMVPSHAWAFTNPIVVLCGEQNTGASEAFLSVMERLPNVTIIGDTTGGAGNIPGYMNQQYWPLMSGIQLTCPFARVLRSDSTPIEDVGVIPDIYVHQSFSSGPSRKDTLLEYAVQYIEERTSD